MRISALIRLGILAISIAGIVLGLVWFVLRPTRFRPGLESASQVSQGPGKVPRYVSLGVGATGIAAALVGLLSTMLTSRRAEVPSSNDVEQVSTTDSIAGRSESANADDSLSKAHAAYPVSFTSLYTHFQKPHPRVWVQTADHNWLETYDGSTSNVFSPEGSIAYNNCPGELLRKRGEPAFEVFLPSSECTPELLFRWNQGKWQDLGPLSSSSESTPTL